jgi:hypothetical protein
MPVEMGSICASAMWPWHFEQDGRGGSSSGSGLVIAITAHGAYAAKTEVEGNCKVPDLLLSVRFPTLVLRQIRRLRLEKARTLLRRPYYLRRFLSQKSLISKTTTIRMVVTDRPPRSGPFGMLV